MKATTAALLMGFSSLHACAAEDPEVARLQQDERIEIHSCRPGTLELGDGADIICVEPWPGGMWPIGPDDVGHERSPGGGPGGGGGGGAPVGRPVMGEPGVAIYEFSLGAWICKSVCATMSYTICRAVEVACAVGSTFTLGGMVLPCVGVVPAACVAGIAGGVACSELFCEDKP